MSWGTMVVIVPGRFILQNLFFFFHSLDVLLLFRLSSCKMRRSAAVFAVDKYRLWWQSQRRKVLEDLAEGTNDKSLAGAVDPKIRPTVDFLNGIGDHFFTLSSCSGRLSLFHKTLPGFQVPKDILAEESRELKMKRGIGLGTIWSTHDPLPQDDIAATAQLLVEKLHKVQEHITSDPQDPRIDGHLVELSFEPMVLHVRTFDLKAADLLLAAGGDSGQRRSGLWRSPFRLQAEEPQTTGAAAGASEEFSRITVSIGSSLSFRVPLVTGGREWSCLGGGGDAPAFDLAPAMTAWLHYGNRLFEENDVRTRRFGEAVAKRYNSTLRGEGMSELIFPAV